MQDLRYQRSHQTGMLTFARDLPNICSLTGLLCAILSIYYAILGNFPAAIIGMIWAVFFDWGDGFIARRMKGRTDEYRAFGGQLDSLIDIVSFGICPAVLLLSYGKFSPWFLPGAFVIVATGVIRLSYFNIFGLVDDSTYMGLALDNNVIILAFVFLFEGFFSHAVFSVIIYTMFMVLSAFNLAPVRTPKFAGRWFYVLMVYTLGLTAIYGGILWSRV
ncbi:MAG: CDP-alcohol phosphatidyltransferase family protein [Deltaproteobacteria bacterium]|nr:CDP-alcohol phosphatidyltransferase family protein [Deltaproteobacteria bacterium]MBW2317420.1 CDP-alcohol phosphatidyltransferase family protein [Deltaproteobacteria bacterium]